MFNSDGIDYLQARDSSNAAKFVVNGNGTLQILDSIKHMGDTDTAIRFPGMIQSQQRLVDQKDFV